MGTIIGRKVKIEVGITEGDAIALTAITQASPPVASTATAHGLVNKSMGYLTVDEGMIELDGQAIRVAAASGTNFTLEGLDTVDASDFESATFTPVTAWATLYESTSYQINDAAADQLDDTKIINDNKQLVAGQLGAQTVTIATKAQVVSAAAMAAVEAAAKKGQYLVIRITLQNNEGQRWLRGVPSLPGENVQAGQLGTGSLTVLPKGWVLKGAGA